MSQYTQNSPTSQQSDNVRRLPHNVDAERAVLGSMLLDNEAITEVMQIVKADDFYLPAHQVIFQAIVEQHDRGQPVELTLLTEDLRKKGKLEEAGGTMGIANLEQSVLYSGAAPELAQSVAEKAVLRRMIHAAETIIRDCTDEKREVDEQVDAAEKLIFDISQQTNTKSFVSLADLMGGAIEQIGHLRAQEGDIAGVRTHFKDLDRLLNGLHPSDLLILAARPSIGKTAFALNIMLNIAWEDRKPVAIFSLEMGAEQLNMRLLCSHARIPGHLVNSGRIKEQDFQRLREVASQMSDVPFYIDDSAGLTLMQLRARARRLKAQVPNLALIVVDYLQLMSGSEGKGREANRQQEVSEISRGLKALARELHVPVLALSQLSRSIEQRSGKSKNAKPMLSDLRESGAIEQDADVVMFVHRERQEANMDEDGKPSQKNAPVPTEIIVGKHRNGPIGTVDLLFWGDFTKFSDVMK